MTVRPEVVLSLLAHLARARSHSSSVSLGSRPASGSPDGAGRGVARGRDAIGGLAGLRTLLVRGYADVDPVRLWVLADTRIDDLRAAHAALAGLPEWDR